MAHWLRWTSLALAASAWPAGAAGVKGKVPAFTVTTTPAGATVETTRGDRCTTPCQVALGRQGFVATVTLLGYKPVQLPVAARRNPGPVTITLVPQDPGAGAPNPVGGGNGR